MVVPFLLSAFLLNLPMAGGVPLGSGVEDGEHGEPAALDSLPGLPVVEHTLPNGMRFLILPRPAVPNVSFVVEFRVGGVDELPGRTGIAHFLEHMLFKGTTSVGTRDVEAEQRLFPHMDALHDSVLAEVARPLPDSGRVAILRGRLRDLEDSARAPIVPGEMDRILSRNGARGLNATTSADATTYYVELPANRAKLWFVVEADRMANPVLREFHTERDVIMEERRYRVETSPGGLLYEAHLAAAFQVHPYGQPVIGHASDIEALTRAEVEDFYRRYYAPANAVVAVVGAVDPDSIRAWADAYFAPLSPGETPPPVRAREPEPVGPRRVKVLHDAEPLLRMGWLTVAGDHPDAPALSMLSAILVGGRTGRLYRRLVVEERLATYVSASLGPGFRFPTLFQVDAAPRAPHTNAELEAAIVSELRRLSETPPDEAELQRIRNQLQAGTVRRLQSNLGLAFQLASSASNYGDWRQTFRFYERMQEVTPEGIQEVVRRYLGTERAVVAMLERPPAGEASP
jgi:predicted Zn-dependent peptidase